MKRDGLLLASLPSSGSDWVACCIAESRPDLVYAREYFCPTVNWRNAADLEKFLGDTMYTNVSRLCRSISESEIETLLQSTWRKDGFSFTKENYVAYQLEAFANTFDIIVLVRKFEHTFPPHRHRVMQWYEHMYCALSIHGLIDSLSIASKTPMERAAIGHYWFTRKLIEVGQALHEPVIWFHDLLSNPPKVPHVGIDFQNIVKQSCRKIDRPDGEYFKQWSSAAKLYVEIEEKYGRLESLC